MIKKYAVMMEWLVGLYVNVLNLIHSMPDKNYDDTTQMALIDAGMRRTFASGITGFSHVRDGYFDPGVYRNSKGESLPPAEKVRPGAGLA